MEIFLHCWRRLELFWIDIHAQFGDGGGIMPRSRKKLVVARSYRVEGSAQSWAGFQNSGVNEEIDVTS